MKLKLEIQRFNSTNQTTHYELSQYTANDKPTYLIDYNGDMSKIDTAIYGADARSQVNAGAIGDLTTLETTAKSDLVSAVNEIKSATDTNTSNIATNTSNISTLGTNQGTMANLTTTDKTSLVGAINEVVAVNTTQNTAIAENTARIDNFNLVAFDDLSFSTSIGTIDNNTMRIATNSDGSLCKIYGSIRVTGYTIGQTATIKTSTPTSLRPTSDISINGYCKFYQDGNGNVIGLSDASLTIKTNGDIEITPGSLANGALTRFIFAPVLIYVKDFGDVPSA